MSLCFFTSVNARYLPKALTLAASVKRHHPEARFIVLYTDEIPEGFDFTSPPFDDVLRMADFDAPPDLSWIFSHSVVELCTAVKGDGFLHLLTKGGFDKVVYLDPDITVMAPMTEIIDLLDSHAAVVTPHQLVPEETRQGVVDNEICSLKHGIYNLGFLAVRKSDEGMAFIRWWRDRLREFCHADICSGLFTDQRWIDLAIPFFPGIHILRGPQYNVATWNLSHRIATGSLAEGIRINGEPLVFYHFSGFDSGAQEVMLERYGTHSPVLFELRDWYIAELERNGEARFSKSRWVYGCYANGERIADRHRVLYRTREDLRRTFPDPFAVPEKARGYWHWLGEQGLLGNAAANSPETMSYELGELRAELDAIHRSRAWRVALFLSQMAARLGLSRRGLGSLGR